MASMVLVACGSGGLGSIQGHDISGGQAVYLASGASNVVFLVTGNMDNVCDVFTGKARPSGSFAVLETLLANWNGTSTDPPVSGAYVQSSAPTAPGLYSLNVAEWGSGCVSYRSAQASSGSVRIESFGGLQAGAHLVVDVNLKFGDDHLSGRVDAVYCGVSQHVCGP